MQRHVVLAEHEHRRRIDQAMADAHVADALAEQRSFSFATTPSAAFSASLRFAVSASSGWATSRSPLRRVAQLLAAVLAEIADHPFVDAIREQQHLDVARLQRLDLRARARRGVRVGRDVPDRVLADLHARDVVVERDGFRGAFGLRRRETQQLRDALAVRRILGDAFLQHVAERVGELAELLRLVAWRAFRADRARASRTRRASAAAAGSPAVSRG